MDNNNFYVYIYKRPNGIPFYVGKGKGRRIHDHLVEAKRENVHNYKVHLIRKIWSEGQEPIIEKVKENLSEDEAFELEKELIKKYGRCDVNENGVLVNKTDGGEGQSGRKLTDEEKEKWRGENNPMYGITGKKHPRYGQTYIMSQEQKDKISKATKNKSKHYKDGKPPMLNKHHTDKTKEKMSNAKKGKPFKERNYELVQINQYDLNNNFLRSWDGIKIAVEELKKQGFKVLSSKICECCKGKRKTCGGFIWKYSN